MGFFSRDEENTNVKIVVTGIAGFIGFHCAKTLLDQGHEICGIDNVNNYYITALKEARLDALRAHGPYTFYQIDLADQQSVNEIFATFKPDAVLHLAAQAGVRHSITHPHDYIHCNIAATMTILEACRHHGQPRLVYASSSSVYGGNPLPFSEDQNVDTPISLYAATKKANELMAHTYSHLYNIQTIGLRFFTVYGPWGRPDMAMWLFAEAIRKGAPIKVFNYGKMRRNFTYINDIVAGVIASLTFENLPKYEVFNLGNDSTEELLDMIQLIEAAVGSKAEKQMLPIQEGDIEATWADIDKARAMLDYKPETSIAEGIPEFVNWYLRHPEFHG
jgi:UDP-glucuronate 4-epimerase